jgi:hypothetical protein
MRRKGYQVTRYADDWVITCKSAAEARAAIVAAQRILEQLGVVLHPQKTRIVHVRQGFEFLGYKIKRGQRPLRLRSQQIQSGVRNGDLYAYPKGKSIQRFMDQVRVRTRRRVPLNTLELIANLNPVITRIELILRWKRERLRLVKQAKIPEQIAGSYRYQGSAACIIATIWLPESALRSFLKKIEDGQRDRCVR